MIKGNDDNDGENDTIQLERMPYPKYIGWKTSFS